MITMLLLLMLMLMQALTETESSVVLHINNVAERHSRNYRLLADSELGSDSGVISLTVAPSSDSGQQEVVDRSTTHQDVVPVVTRSGTTTSSHFTSSSSATFLSASIDHGIR